MHWCLDCLQAGWILDKRARAVMLHCVHPMEGLDWLAPFKVQWESEFKTREQLMQPTGHLRVRDITDDVEVLNGLKDQPAQEPAEAASACIASTGTKEGPQMLH